LANYVKPRTLQEFLGTDVWDQEKMRDRLQQVVARDHLQYDSIGMVDDSGHAKCGSHTACVSRQYSGRSGKVDNCVVTVNLSLASFDTRFRVMLDSVPFLPKCWNTDQQRRSRAHVPDDVRYRPKYDIALEEVDRARGNGVFLSWLTGDCWYGQKPKFLAGLHRREQRFVMEIPCNFRCWSHDPSSAARPSPAKEVRNLARYSKHMMQQAWTRVYLKDTEKGPLVWEAKAMPVWLTLEGEMVGPWWLVWARDVTDPSQEKFFLSNASAGVPFEVILHVGFARWPIERCLEDEKSELGMSHFEVRKYPSICRHLIMTMVSHLFLSREADRLRGEKWGDHNLPSARRDAYVAEHAVALAGGPAEGVGTSNGDRSVLPTSQRRSPRFSYENRSQNSRPPRDRPEKPRLLQTAG
jgi:SRSO17 transposase